MHRSAECCSELQLACAGGSCADPGRDSSGIQGAAVCGKGGRWSLLEILAGRVSHAASDGSGLKAWPRHTALECPLYMRAMISQC